MLREVELDELTDGKFYEINDMAKIGCNDCKGCFDCCHDMGTSIILDPLDIHRMIQVSGLKFEELLLDKIELNMVDAIILPNIKMTKSLNCPFLNDEKRCSIHNMRPGYCRLFPLGRLYENGDYKYIVQVHECKMEPKTKVKIKSWIGEPEVTKHHEFINNWHQFLLCVSDRLTDPNLSDDDRKRITMFILTMFYLTPFRKDTNFYDIFNERLKNAKSALDIED